MKLGLLVRRPMGAEDGELQPARIAVLAREIREFAQKRLGEEIVVDVLWDRDSEELTA